MTQQQFQTLLRKYRQGLCNPEEEKLISDWYDSIGSDIEFNLVSEDAEVLEKEYWNNINDHIRQSKTGKKPRGQSASFFSLRYASAAAVILAVVSFVYLFSSKTIDSNIFSKPDFSQGSLREINNTNNDPMEIALQDGSRITLQVGSKISYPEPFNSSQREIYLEGEAFFEVAKDPAHPFLVYTNEVTTKVLGTSFLVRANKDEKEIIVTVKTGRVMVYAQSSKMDKKSKEDVQEVVLKPNQQVVYNRKSESVEKKLVEKPEIVLPQPTFKMNYSNAPVTEIFEALEESYGVDIQFDKEALSACTLTTDLSEEGLYERIEIICNALGATYTSIGTAIVIEATRCK
ncbi:MAG: FecR domain-containing protein [Chryseolinea sp.]